MSFGVILSNKSLIDVTVQYLQLRRQKHRIILLASQSCRDTGNDQADSAAKAALNLGISPSKLPYTDFKGLINESLKSSWQSAWDTAITNKLHSVKPVLGEWLPSFRTNRREEVVLARCRQGHTSYTHSFLFFVAKSHRNVFLVLNLCL